MPQTAQKYPITSIITESYKKNHHMYIFHDDFKRKSFEIIHHYMQYNYKYIITIQSAIFSPHFMPSVTPFCTQWPLKQSENVITSSRK